MKKTSVIFCIVLLAGCSSKDSSVLNYEDASQCTDSQRDNELEGSWYARDLGVNKNRCIGITAEDMEEGVWEFYTSTDEDGNKLACKRHLIRSWAKPICRTVQAHQQLCKQNIGGADWFCVVDS